MAVPPPHMSLVCGLLMIPAQAIWSASDDGTIRVWDAAYGLFSLDTEPCTATLHGHHGAVHALLTMHGLSLIHI